MTGNSDRVARRLTVICPHIDSGMLSAIQMGKRRVSGAVIFQFCMGEFLAYLGFGTRSGGVVLLNVVAFGQSLAIHLQLQPHT